MIKTTPNRGMMVPHEGRFISWFKKKKLAKIIIRPKKVKAFEYFDSLSDGLFNSMKAKHEPIKSSQALVKIW